MITLLVFDKETEVKEKQKRERTLMWYNVNKKQMFSFKGGYLDLSTMIYDEELEMNRPKICDSEVEISNKVKSRKDTLSWFHNYENYNATKIVIISENEEGIIICFPEKEEDDILYDLDRNNINCTEE